jgi:hypothetical protein
VTLDTSEQFISQHKKYSFTSVQTCSVNQLTNVYLKCAYKGEVPPDHFIPFLFDAPIANKLSYVVSYNFSHAWPLEVILDRAGAVN